MDTQSSIITIVASPLDIIWNIPTFDLVSQQVCGVPPIFGHLLTFKRNALGVNQLWIRSRGNNIRGCGGFSFNPLKTIVHSISDDICHLYMLKINLIILNWTYNIYLILIMFAGWCGIMGHFCRFRTQKAIETTSSSWFVRGFLPLPLMFTWTL